MQTDKAHYDTLVLSGNSTNAVATMGALQHLIDGLEIVSQKLTTFVATSSGSLISTFMAIDYNPIDILCWLCASKSYSKITGLNLTNLGYGGLIDFQPIEREMEDMIIAKIGYVPTLDQIKTRFNKTLIFVTFNMTDGEKEYISHQTYPNLPVTKAARMSSTFPFVFSPFEYNGTYYVDGGVVDNFAMNYAQTLGGKCLGMYNVNPIEPYTLDTNHLALFFRLLFVFISSSAENASISKNSQSKIIRLTFDPSFFNFNCSNFDLIRLFDTGYDECKTFCITNKNES